MNLVLMKNLPFLFFSLWLLLSADAFCQDQQAVSAPAGQTGLSGDAVDRDLSEGAVNSAIRPVQALPPARVYHAAGVTSQDSTKIHLGDFVKLKVLHLSREMRLNGNLKPEQLRLFVDDIVLTKVPPYSADTANGIVVFPLSRSLASEPFWQIFYHFPRKFEHPGHLGIGSEVAQIAESYPTKGDIKIVLIQKSSLHAGAILALVLGAFLYFLGKRTRLIREDWSKQWDESPGKISRIPFSLSKVQLAFWTYLIVMAYFVIWLVTGELPTIPESLLALLGISISEKILGRGINLKQTQNMDHLRQSQHVAVFRVQDRPSAGFLWDILSDENGVSIARLQFVLFNLIIGASFIRNMIKSWSLLDIDTSSLVLLTISGAGYLIMKNTENTNPALPAAPPPAAAPAGAGPAGNQQQADQQQPGPAGPASPVTP